MINRSFTAAGALALFSVSGVTPAAWAQTDQVFPVRGAPARGTVTAITRDQVSLDAAGSNRQIAVNEISRIAFGDEPSELNAARMAALQKNYAAAAAELKKVDPTKISREFVKQDFEFYKALCQARQALSEGGDKKAAIDAMFSFVRGAQQSYHFYEAAEVLGDLSMAAGKYSDAATRYYGATGVAGAPWPEYQMRGNSAVGRALIADKQFDQALAKFDAVISTELSTPEAARQKLLATAGKAICLAETGKAEEGLALLQDVINKNDPQDAALFARTYNAMGRCYQKQNKPKDALLAYLHTDVLFYTDADAHAEALYNLSKLWGDVNKQDRAVAARTTLKERYAGSVWASLE